MSLGNIPLMNVASEINSVLYVVTKQFDLGAESMTSHGG